MTHFELVMLSTYNGTDHIDSMISSVQDNNTSVKVLLIVVNQTNDFRNIVANGDFTTVRILNHCKSLSLSKARNIGIEYLNNMNIEFDHIMFPDDDSTFSEVFFKNFKRVVQKGKSYLIDVYCTGSCKLFKHMIHKEGEIILHQHYASAMSVNMIVDRKTFLQSGLFDERLGIGTYFGAGEDGDYFLRCSNHTQFLFTHQLYNYHPAASTEFMKMGFRSTFSKFLSYGRGVIFMLIIHKRYLSATYICFRAILGSFSSLIQFRFRIAFIYFIVFFYRSFFFLRCILNTKTLIK